MKWPVQPPDDNITDKQSPAPPGQGLAETGQPIVLSSHSVSVSSGKTRILKEEERAEEAQQIERPVAAEQQETAQQATNANQAPNAEPQSSPRVLLPDFDKVDSQSAVLPLPPLRRRKATSLPRWENWIASLQQKKWFDPLRGILIFAPVTLTWISVLFASIEYSQSVENDPSLVTTAPMLQQWAEGFPKLKTISLFYGHWQPPMDIGGFRPSSLWFEASLTLLFLFVLVFLTWIANYPIASEPTAQMSAGNTLQALDEAVSNLRGVLEDLREPVEIIGDSITKLGDSSSDVKKVITDIHQTFYRFESTLSGFRKGLENLKNEQNAMKHVMSEASTSLNKTSEALTLIAEPFREAGVEEVVRQAVEQMKMAGKMQQTVLGQQTNLYQQQQILYDAINKQLILLQQLQTSSPWQAQPTLAGWLQIGWQKTRKRFKRMFP